MTTLTTTRETLLRKNRELYDSTSDPMWRIVAYEPLHAGWEFINLGGCWLLDETARRAPLTAASRVLDLCCGQGAAARYLADRTGCAVVGLDLNAAQIRAARARLLQPSRFRTLRVSYFQADALEWRDAIAYDTVICLDALMLIPDANALLETARAALRPGGMLTLSTIGAGTALDDRLRRFAWEVDGMATLPATRELDSALAAAGFSRIEVEDITPRAIAASETMRAALDGSRSLLVASHGERAWAGWYQTNDVYLGAFASGALRYLFATALR